MAFPWAVGTVGVHQLPNAPGLVAGIVLVALAMLAWVFLSWRWLAWLIAGVLWTSLHIHARLADRLDAELQGRDVMVVGWVDNFPKRATGQVSFSFRVHTALSAEGIPSRLRLTWYDPSEAITPGSAFELVVRLKQPRGVRNPGGFDYERWLFQEGYGATGYVRHGNGWLQAPSGLARTWLRLRAQLAEKIIRAAPSDDAGAFLTALAIGERFRFDERHWRGLRRTGTSHLVAISGLHIGLVAGLVFLLSRRLTLYWPGIVATFDLEVAAVVSFSCGALYAALAGFTVPTQRALIMLTVALAALVARRSITAGSGFSLALLFVLVWDPLAALSASFWLSFTAVALLWWLGRRQELETRRLWGRVKGLAQIQWGISLGLVPVVALFFAEVSLISPLVNFFVIPLFSLLIIPLTLTASLALWLHPGGAILVMVAGALLQRVWDGIERLAELPWSAIVLNHPPWWAFSLSCVGVVAALGTSPRYGRYVAWIALLPLFFARQERVGPEAVEVTLLDVGHGLSVLVETQHHNLIYDAGPLFRSGFDTGREIVLPSMRARGWTSLDLLLISHADNDHSGGARAVIDAFPDAGILMGPDVSLPGGQHCETGQRWVWDGVTFAILHPDETFPQRGNESSCVLKISAPAGTVLITGDIEAAAERSLMTRPGELRADVVVVPHHGSATSSSIAFVASTKPAFALASAGRGNQWDFPKPEVAARWENVGAELIVTGDGGAVTVRLGPDRGLELDTQRRLRRRYWSGSMDPL